MMECLVTAYIRSFKSPKLLKSMRYIVKETFKYSEISVFLKIFFFFFSFMEV